MTPAERRLWAALRRSKAGGLHFRRQQIVGKYVVDFYCDAARLAIELDGGPHHHRGDSDLRRDLDLERVGVAVIRIPNEAIHAEPDMLLAWIVERAKERAENLRRPNPRPLPSREGEPDRLRAEVERGTYRHGRQHLPRISPL